ncbi:hypothetical protein AMECASPLE_001974 [Ameca splendens]|uniref:Uncharacterized protein n=1 Tax=Ameca splendens TaxID=208324 RepID=A0ABV0YW56_9TELE
MGALYYPVPHTVCLCSSLKGLQTSTAPVRLLLADADFQVSLSSDPPVLILIPVLFKGPEEERSSGCSFLVRVAALNPPEYCKIIPMSASEHLPLNVSDFY